jgi:membrane-associated phospholipid phosphatase
MLVVYFLPAAMFAPAIFGRWMPAREFLIANVVAMILGIAAFAFLPAIGPWYGYHIPPHPDQTWCQAQLLLMRAPGKYIAEEVGVVCFPSFHVIWAIFCARALWTFRYFRVPVCLFAGMICLSTLTTGWHYFSDVLGGIAVACISIRIAASIVRRQSRPAAAAIPMQVVVPAIANPAFTMAHD